MKTKTETLISNLTERTKNHMNQAEKFSQLRLEELNKKSSPESWSVLECIEHLNRYGDYYLPEIEGRLRNNKTTPDPEFKSGLIGNYFAEMMLPGEKVKKMKTFKSMNPAGSKLDKKVLTKFIDQQKKMLELLDRSREVSLNKTKTSISISNLIKLKLGDTFRVVIYHNERHVVQAAAQVRC